MIKYFYTLMMTATEKDKRKVTGETVNVKNKEQFYCTC